MCQGKGKKQKYKARNQGKKQSKSQHFKHQIYHVLNDIKLNDIIS